MSLVARHQTTKTAINSRQTSGKLERVQNTANIETQKSLPLRAPASKEQELPRHHRRVELARIRNWEGRDGGSGPELSGPPFTQTHELYNRLAFPVRQQEVHFTPYCIRPSGSRAASFQDTNTDPASLGGCCGEGLVKRRRCSSTPSWRGRSRPGARPS